MCVSFSQSEREEFETEYKQKYERERVLLLEENKKLSSELDKVKYLLIQYCMYIYTSPVSLPFLSFFHSFCQCFSNLLSQLFSQMIISLRHTYRKTQFPNPR